MAEENRIFEKTYKDYIKQIGMLDLKTSGEKAGLEYINDELLIPLLDKQFCVSKNGIDDGSGIQPGFDICVILSRYVLMLNDEKPDHEDWAAFRDFKDAGPLETYYANDVEGAVSKWFSGKKDLLEKAVKTLNGSTPSPPIELNYDLVAELTLLPGLNALLTFNDADDEFPAACSVLFRGNADCYLDAESLAVLGRFLFIKLKNYAS